jgi:hypothetical protein
MCSYTKRAWNVITSQCFQSNAYSAPTGDVSGSQSWFETNFPSLPWDPHFLGLSAPSQPIGCSGGAPDRSKGKSRERSMNFINTRFIRQPPNLYGYDGTERKILSRLSGKPLVDAYSKRSMNLIEKVKVSAYKTYTCIFTMHLTVQRARTINGRLCCYLHSKVWLPIFLIKPKIDEFPDPNLLGLIRTAYSYRTAFKTRMRLSRCRFRRL